MKFRLLMLLLTAGLVYAAIIPEKVGNKWYYYVDHPMMWCDFEPDSGVVRIYQIDSIKQLSSQNRRLFISVRDSLINDSATISHYETWDQSDSTVIRFSPTYYPKPAILAFDKRYNSSQVLIDDGWYHSYSVYVDSISINGGMKRFQTYNEYHGSTFVPWNYLIQTVKEVGITMFFGRDMTRTEAYKLYATEFNGIYTEINISPSSINNPDNSYKNGDFFLSNYPNPFNNTTMISFENPVMAKVKLTVFDSNGREVVQLLNQNFSGGKHTVAFNAEKLNSGVYFYRLELNGKQSAIQKMILVK